MAERNLQLPMNFSAFNSSQTNGLWSVALALFFANKVKPRETVTTIIEYKRILHFEQSLLPEAISGWECTPFTSTVFDHWWQ